jgi:hypothetical protein
MSLSRGTLSLSFRTATRTRTPQIPPTPSATVTATGTATFERLPLALMGVVASRPAPCFALLDVALFSPLIRTAAQQRAQQRGLTMATNAGGGSAFRWDALLSLEVAGEGSVGLVAQFPAAPNASIALLSSSPLTVNVSAVAAFRFRVTGSIAQIVLRYAPTSSIVVIDIPSDGCVAGGGEAGPPTVVTRFVAPDGSTAGGAEAPGPDETGAQQVNVWRLAAGAVGAIVLAVAFVTL